MQWKPMNGNVLSARKSSPASAAPTPVPKKIQLGKYYTGVWRYRDDAGEIIFVFEQNKGTTVSGYICDPVDFKRRKAFSGTILPPTGKSDELEVVVEAKPTGLRNEDAVNKTSQEWLREGNSYKVRFKTADGDSITGTAGNTILSLTAMPQSSFVALNQENENRIAARRNQVLASVSPDVTYAGTWSSGNESGEVNIVFQRMSPQKTTVEGQLYDPNYSNERVNFKGTLFLEENAQYQLKLEMTRRDERGRLQIKSDTQRRLIFFDGNGFNSSFELYFSVTGQGIESTSPTRSRVSFKRAR